MTLLFLSYWPYHDGLTNATVHPHIKVLRNFEWVEKVWLITIERHSKIPSQDEFHIPIHSGEGTLDKIKDLLFIPDKIRSTLKEKNIDYLICRSSMAGTLGYFATRNTNVPASVESFEPHADYMYFSGIWKKWDPRYILQKRLEKKQMRAARWLLPLTESFKRDLVATGIHPNKLLVLPCVLDVQQFQFNLKDRERIRTELSFGEHPVGIYVGKKGGIYYDSEIFEFFKYLHLHIPKIKFLILTPQKHSEWEFNFEKVKIPTKSYKILTVKNENVTAYLSAADFAFNFHISSEVSPAFSPIKNAEYWANGLPILIDENIGDDSDIIKKEGGGMVVDFNQPISDEQVRDFVNLANEYNANRVDNISTGLAKKYRSFDQIKDVYSKVLSYFN